MKTIQAFQALLAAADEDLATECAAAATASLTGDVETLRAIARRIYRLRAARLAVGNTYSELVGAREISPDPISAPTPPPAPSSKPASSKGRVAA